tara:strand:- start:85 stop:909 length:825 start_codon:yes stop_codon:yes gene_type:complete
MYRKLILIVILAISVTSCSKENSLEYEPQKKLDPYKLYKEAYKAFQDGDYFFAHKKFSEAELNFEIVEHAAKSAIMSSYALYGINFYEEAIDNLERYLKKYLADKNVIYAHYLMAIIYYEQISDEKKDLQPLLKAKTKIDFFIKEYPNSDYSTDLKFKKDLIQNQLAAKEMYVAKYYISVQKWIPAINRLKIIVNDYQETIFVEEALHRLVEIYYYLGLLNEAEQYAKILGYNYNSSEWFKQSYKVLNKEYKIIKKQSDIKGKGFFKDILEKIR